MLPDLATPVRTPPRSTQDASREELQQRIRLALSILGHLPNPSHTTARLVGVLRGEVSL